MDAARISQVRPPTARIAWRVSPFRLGLALVVLALAVRAIGLGLRPMWLDEAFSDWFSGQSWHYLWTVLPTYEAHPPVYYSLLKFWRQLFGDSAVALRALSALCGAATVPVVMAIAFEQEREHDGGRRLLRIGAAGLLVACSPLLVVVGQEARPYPLLIFGYSVAILGLVRLARQFKDGGVGSGSSWLMLVLGAELTLWAHALGFLYAACLAAALAPAWLNRPISKGRIVRGLLAGLAIVLLYLPCLQMIAGRASDWRANWLRWNPDMLLQLFGLYSVPAGELTAGALAAAIATLLLIKRALQGGVEARGWSSDRAILLLWLGPALLSALVSAFVVPVFLARTLAATLVPAYLAMAGALARTPSRRERMIVVATLCISLVPLAVQSALRAPAERWDSVSAYLHRNVSAGDQVWLYPSDSALPLGKVDGHIPGFVRAVPAPFPTLGVNGPMRAGWPAMVSVTAGQAAKLASDPALKTVPTIWLVTRQSRIFDPAGDMAAALSRVRRPGQLQEWGYITVQPYSARPR